MKELLLLCSKNVHFTFNNDIYQQCDGVAMGSPMGPVIAGIFMVELARTLIPKINRIHDSMETICRRYHCYNKININRLCFKNTQHLPQGH